MTQLGRQSAVSAPRTVLYCLLFIAAIVKPEPAKRLYRTCQLIDTSNQSVPANTYQPLVLIPDTGSRH